MNIKDFLVEHYIYIIIVIVLTIVTIIGFLADKKKNSDKRPKTMSGTINNTPNQNMPNMNYQQPINMNQPVNYQPTTNSMPNNNMAYNQPQPAAPVQQDNLQMNMSNSQMVNSIPQMNSPVPNTIPSQVNEMNYNIPQPVEQMSPNVPTNENMYQPLSEQKPTFAPVEPNIMNNMQGSSPMPMPEPVQNVMPSQAMPESVPYMAGAQPMMNNNQQPMPMPNMNNNPVPTPIAPPQPVSPQQINFVYGNGNQGNNGGYMQ